VLINKEEAMDNDLYLAIKKGSRPDLEIQELSDLYDLLIEEARRELKRDEPCYIREGECRRNLKRCCKGCEHLSKEKGCKVECLACVLWLCPAARINFKQCSKKLAELENVGIAYGLVEERKSKEEIFSEGIFGLRARSCKFWALG
jgi:hypothetical protein